MWLNLALQPCALALDRMDDHDCPHCPPTETGEHGDYAMSAHASAMDKMPCATSADDCSPIDDFNYHGRNTELKLKDAPSDLPLAIHPSITQVPATRCSPGIGWRPSRSSPPGKQVSLNILYCVFLK